MIKMLVIVVVSSFFLCLVNCDQCMLHDNGTHKEHKEELLKKISLLNDQKFVCESDGYTYAMAICHEVSKEHPKAAVTSSLSKNLKNTTVVLGRYNNVDIVGTDDWILLTYADGDKIVDNTSCNGSVWKAMILITCDKENDKFYLLEGHSAACMALFHLKLNILCPEQSWSGAAIFFTMLLVGFLLYFTIGITYRRFVLGAKGYEQVPNYTVWSYLLTLPRELLLKLLSGNGPRHDLGTGHQRSQPMGPADAADEPLLSP